MDKADTTPAATPHFKLGTRPSLDGIRGLGIIFVVIFHSMTYLVDWYGPYGESVLPGAFLSVDIFFALSGFLITSLLLEERVRHGAFSMKLFYARRALRLLPPLFAALAVFGVYVVLSPEAAVGDYLRAVFRMLTYTSNFVIGEDGFLTTWFGQSWSLAIEEQFYIVWPLALVGLLALTRGNAKAMAGILAGIVVAFAVWRFALIEMHDGLWSSVYYRTDARLDQPLVGALLAVLLHYGLIKDKPRPWIGVASLAVWLGASVLASPFEVAYYKGWAPLMLITSTGLMLGVMHGEGLAAKVLGVRPLRWFGRLSYTLYLVHVAVFVATLLALPGEGRNVLRVVVANALALVLTVLIHRLVEKPALRIKGRFNRSPRDKATAASAEAAAEPAVPAGVRRRPLRADDDLDGPGEVAPAPAGGS